MSNAPTAVTFYSDGTGTAEVAGQPQSLTWVLTGSKLTLSFPSTTNIATGTLKWTDLDDITYSYTDTKSGKTVLKSLTLARQVP